MYPALSWARSIKFAFGQNLALGFFFEF